MPIAEFGPLASRRITLHGELTPDGRVLLVAEGPAHLVAVTAQALSTLTPRFDEVEGLGLVVAVSWTLVTQLALSPLWVWAPGPRLRAWVADQFIRRTAAPWALRYGYRPPGKELRGYQVDGACAIAAVGRYLIWDDPGTGKTITTLAGLAERAHLGVAVPPVVVVSPASVVDAWVAAAREWIPGWRTVAWRGPGRHRLVGKADVYVTSYDLARRDAGPADQRRVAPSKRTTRALLELRPQAVVIDEAHRIAHADSKQSLAVRRLAAVAPTVVALTGTPLLKHLGHLWSTLNALDPAGHPSKERFVNRYCLSFPTDFGDGIFGTNPATEEEFRQALMGSWRRVAKEDALDLPPKVSVTRVVDMPREWRTVYDELEAQMLAEVDGQPDLAVFDVLSQLTRLRQLSSCAADIGEPYWVVDEKTGEEKRKQDVKLRLPSWKINDLLEILEERPGRQVLVFAESRQLITLAGQQVAKELGKSTAYVVGGQTARQRSADVDAFQAGERDVILATTQAGGVGITLTAASTVVFLQRPFSYVDAVQAEDRAHRIGSERHDSVEIIDVLTRNTVDSRIRDILLQKAESTADLFQDRRVVSRLFGGKSN